MNFYVSYDKKYKEKCYTNSKSSQEGEIQQHTFTDYKQRVLRIFQNDILQTSYPYSIFDRFEILH